MTASGERPTQLSARRFARAIRLRPLLRAGRRWPRLSPLRRIAQRSPVAHRRWASVGRAPNPGVPLGFRAMRRSVSLPGRDVSRLGSVSARPHPVDREATACHAQHQLPGRRGAAISPRPAPSSRTTVRLPAGRRTDGARAAPPVPQPAGPLSPTAGTRPAMPLIRAAPRAVSPAVMRDADVAHHVPRAGRSPATRLLEALPALPVPTAPLPTRFAHLVRAIVPHGPRPRLATGATVSRALRAAGRPAATVGATIFLPAAPDGSASGRDVVAHELAHVAQHTASHTGLRSRRVRTTRRPSLSPAASPGPLVTTAPPAGSRRGRGTPFGLRPPYAVAAPAPRFFGGDGRPGSDPSEVEAAAIGHRARRWRAAALPASTGQHPRLIGPGPAAITRTVATGGRPSSALAVDAAPPMTWRLPTSPAPIAPAAQTPAISAPALAPQGPTGEAGATASPAAAATDVAALASDPMLLAKLIDALEHRLLEEAERRGGRYAGVF